MSYSAKVGSFNIDTSKTAGQTQAITGVGFQPKVVMFWWGGSTGTGDSVGGGTIRFGFGAATDSTHRFCAIIYSRDAQAASETARYIETDQVIMVRLDGSNSKEGYLDFSSMDADGFTLIVDDQFANAYRISYLALGGDDLTNVYVGTDTIKTTTGNKDITGAGFQPDAVILAYSHILGLDVFYQTAIVSIGMATDSAEQGVVAAYVAEASATSSTKGYGYNGEILAGPTGASSITERASFVAFIENGFTFNQLETGGGARYFGYICLKGGQYKVHELTTRTDGNDITESDVGFQPVALLFTSANRALSTQDTVSNDARLSIGAATSSSERACAAISDEDNLADTETAYSNYDSAVYSHIVDDANAGLMDIKSIDAGGFTCVMDTNDASACWVTYLAIGANEEEGCVNVIVNTVVVTDDCV